MAQGQTILHRWFEEVWNQRRESAIDEMIADNYVGHGLVGPDGALVEAITAYFRDLLAAGRAESTVRSYGLDLLRWFGTD